MLLLIASACADQHVTFTDKVVADLTTGLPDCQWEPCWRGTDPYGSFPAKEALSLQRAAKHKH